MALALVATLLAFAPSPAAAKAPARGQYSLGEAQTICVRDDGSWFNMNLPIAGRWQHFAPWTYFAGDYDPGGGLHGHVAFRAHVVRGTLDITDWGNDFEWFSVTLGLRFERLARNCPTASQGDGAGAGASAR